MRAEQIVELLNDLFTRFDLAARDLGIEKLRRLVMHTWQSAVCLTLRESC